MDAIELPMDVEFQIHATALAIQQLDRDDLEEAFIEMLHQRALDRQMFYGVLKDHGIDADIKFNISTGELDEKIIDALNEYIRPAVENDGGSIDFVEFKDGIVKVALRGACSGCPSSTVTLKQGIEGLLTRMFPEVKGVESISL